MGEITPGLPHDDAITVTLPEALPFGQIAIRDGSIVIEKADEVSLIGTVESIHDGYRITLADRLLPAGFSAVARSDGFTITSAGTGLPFGSVLRDGLKLTVTMYTYETTDVAPSFAGGWDLAKPNWEIASPPADDGANPSSTLFRTWEAFGRWLPRRIRREMFELALNDLLQSFLEEEGICESSAGRFRVKLVFTLKVAWQVPQCIGLAIRGRIVPFYVELVLSHWRRFLN